MTNKQKKEKKQIDGKKEQKEKNKEQAEKQTKEKEEQEIELKEISLEELAEQPELQTIIEADNFSEFMLSETSAEMPTLTLPSSPIPTPVDAGGENLEELRREARGTRETSEAGEIERREYVTIYNPPQYTAGTSEETILKDTRERGMSGRTVEELRHIRPRVMMEDWHEAGETRERAREMSRDYLVVETERREEEKSPLEQKRKYRELKRGK